MNKQGLREESKALLKAISLERRIEARENLTEFLQKELVGYAKVLSFSSIQNEIDLSWINALLKKEERLTLDPKGDFDCILVPGLAFDKNGARLGRGGGFYDKLLSQHPEVMAIGICFKEQVIEKIPLEPHDRKVYKVCAF